MKVVLVAKGIVVADFRAEGATQEEVVEAVEKKLRMKGNIHYYQASSIDRGIVVASHKNELRPNQARAYAKQYLSNVAGTI